MPRTEAPPSSGAPSSRACASGEGSAVPRRASARACAARTAASAPSTSASSAGIPRVSTGVVSAGGAGGGRRVCRPRRLPSPSRRSERTRGAASSARRSASAAAASARASSRAGLGLARPHATHSLAVSPGSPTSRRASGSTTWSATGSSCTRRWSISGMPSARRQAPSTLSRSLPGSKKGSRRPGKPRAAASSSSTSTRAPRCPSTTAETRPGSAPPSTTASQRRVRGCCRRPAEGSEASARLLGAPLERPEQERWVVGRLRLDLAHAVAALTERLEALHRLGCLLARDDQEHPDAAVEDAQHLVLLDLADALEQREEGGAGPGGRVDACPHALRQHARHVADEAPAGDVDEALQVEVAAQVQDRLDVDARRREQRAAERGVELVVLAAQVELARLHAGVDDLAHERVAVAVDAARGEPEDRVALADRGAVDQPVPLDHADAEADHLEVALAVEARHRGRLAAEQRAARAAAALGDPAQSLAGELGA